jgi:hypothetical protein
VPIDWLATLGGEHPGATAAVAGFATFAFGVLFGFKLRTFAAVAALVCVVNGWYPGGSAGLVGDVLAPVRSLMDDATTRRDARGARIAGAASDRPTAPRR